MDTEVLSTVIDTDAGPSAAGGGAPKLAEPTPIPSVRDDLEAAFKADDEAKAAEKPEAADKAPEKPVPDAKDEPKAPEKAEEKAAAEKPGEAKPDAEKGEAKPDAKAEEAKEEKAEQKDGRRHYEAPAKFLPRAKELWRNTPNEVKAEVDRVLRETEEETARVRETTQRYEQLREYDELARRNGRDLRESLVRINHFENLLQTNPIAGLNAIMMEVGPRKADGQPISLMEVADFLVKQGPQGYQQIVSHQPQAQTQQQPNPEVEQLRNELAEMKAMQATRDIIEPFAAKHPRYTELQDDIAFFLQSGKIPESLSPSERLTAAYDMAERINPPSHVQQAAVVDEPASDRRADNDFGGSTKSIKSSPGSVSEDVDSVAGQGESIEESLRKELRRMRA